MLDPYQVVESRTLGADCILLIMAILDDGQADELESMARDLGMDTLVEVHDEAELDRALALHSSLIGVNNRNLKTFETNLATTVKLAARLPHERFLVSESGLYTRADLDRMADAGAQAFLVGESLMCEKDIEAATKKLLGPYNNNDVKTEVVGRD
jgi:indole-3-glycerol phosphate synthase